MITTIEDPIADFSMDNVLGCSPMGVNFTNNSSPTNVLNYNWQFGDGNSSNLNNPSHIFNNSSHVIDSLYTIKLVATAGTGCTDTAFGQVNVYALPIANFTYTPNCMLQSTSFQDSSISATQAITNWEWDFGNGNTSFIQNPSNIYTTGGSFDVSLNIINGNGCTDSIQKPIIVYALPIVNYTHDSLVCENDIVLFNNLTTGADTYSWNFGNSLSSTLQSPTTSYSQAGNFPIKLIAQSTFGCIDSNSSSIHVMSTPIAYFTPIPDNGCAPLSVFFQNQSSGLNTTFYWNFKNGQTSNLENPMPVIYNQGMTDTTYYPILNVVNQCGSNSYTDTITVHPQPMAKFDMDMNYGCSPILINFSDNQTYGDPDTLIWIFGDGSQPVITTDPTALQPVQHLFITDTVESVYTVTFIAINGCGSDTMTKQVTVHPNNVNAFFYADTLSGCVPLTISFTNTSIGNTLSTWDFGDGTYSNQMQPTHTFMQSGYFDVHLIVTDSCAYDTTDLGILVYPKPVIDFTTSVDTVCVNDYITFTNASPNPLINLIWEFGDGDTSINTNTTHHYQTAGIYSVSLSGTSAGYNCPNMATKYIVVLPTPVSHINASSLVGCPPLLVALQGDSSYNSWDLGNGNTSSLNIVNEIYYIPGTYHVTLVSEFANGCSDTDNIDILIHPSPTSIFQQSVDSTCIIPIEILFTNNSIGANGFIWNFGNGYSTTINDSINILFTNTGVFTNSLIVSNQYGCSDTSYNQLLVYPKPVSQASMSPSKGCEPLDVQFSNTSSNSNSYLWLFGDGGSSIFQNPLYTYNNTGDYNVKLISYGSAGCSDTITISDTVEVYPTPIAAFSYTKIQVPIQNSGQVQFNNNSLLADSYFWRFSDNSTSTEINPLHRFEMYGDYNVLLYAENTYGCWDTSFVWVRISEFHGLFVSNAFSPAYGPDEVRTFKPKGIGLKTYHIYIYDNWGNLLWDSSKLINGEPAEGWDGNDKAGYSMPQDTYVWKVEATFLDGSIWPGKTYDNGLTKPYGTVTLIR